MKLALAYILAVAWGSFWFLGCGGETSVTNSNQQSQNQASDEAEIQTAQEACSFCVDSRGKDETLSECVMSLGFEIADC